MADEGLPTGVYEQLLTRLLEARLTGLQSESVAVDEAEQPQVLGDHVGRRVAAALQALPADERVDWVNHLLAQLPGDEVLAGPRQLQAVARDGDPGLWAMLHRRPTVPLSRPALLTNAASDPKLGRRAAR